MFLSDRIVGYFCGVLILVIFVVNPHVTKFFTHEIFHPHSDPRHFVMALFFATCALLTVHLIHSVPFLKLARYASTNRVASHTRLDAETLHLLPLNPNVTSSKLMWQGKSLGGGYENINLGYSQDQCCS